MSEEKRVVELDRYEYGAVVNIINEKRNSMMDEKKDTEFVSEILSKVLKAPKKKKFTLKKDRYER